MPPSEDPDKLKVFGLFHDDSGGSGVGSSGGVGRDGGNGNALFFSSYSFPPLPSPSFAIPLPSSSDALGHAGVPVSEEEGQRAGEGRVG